MHHYRRQRVTASGHASSPPATTDKTTPDTPTQIHPVGLRSTAVPGLPPSRLSRLPLPAAVCAVVSCPVAGCAAPGGGGRAPGPSPASAGSTIHLPSRARPSPAGVAPAGAVPVVAGGPARLAGQLPPADTVLRGGDAPPALM